MYRNDTGDFFGFSKIITLCQKCVIPEKLATAWCFNVLFFLVKCLFFFRSSSSIFSFTWKTWQYLVAIPSSPLTRPFYLIIYCVFIIYLFLNRIKRYMYRGFGWLFLKSQCFLKYCTCSFMEEKYIPYLSFLLELN